MAAVAPDDVQETVNALMHMAREFEEDECPLQAVKCYEAICNKNHLTVLPLPEARARVALSRLRLAVRDVGSTNRNEAGLPRADPYNSRATRRPLQLATCVTRDA